MRQALPPAVRESPEAYAGCVSGALLKDEYLEAIQAAGFEAIAVGYSLRYPDDLENRSKQFEVYDALYAWCRLDIAGNQV